MCAVRKTFVTKPAPIQVRPLGRVIGDFVSHERARDRVIPEHQLERAVEEVTARAPDPDAFQRPIGGRHCVPVLHYSRKPTPGGAGGIHVPGAVKKHHAGIQGNPRPPLGLAGTGLLSPIQRQDART